MLSFLKKLFGFGSAPAAEAPYKVEAPSLDVVDTPVEVVPVTESVLPVVTAPITESVLPVAAKKPRAKKPAVIKAVAEKKPRAKKAPKA